MCVYVCMFMCASMYIYIYIYIYTYIYIYVDIYTHTKTTHLLINGFTYNDPFNRSTRIDDDYDATRPATPPRCAQAQLPQNLTPALLLPKASPLVHERRVCVYVCIYIYISM